MTNIFKPNNKVKLSLAFSLAIILTLGLSLSLQSVAAAVLSTPYKGVQLGNAGYSLIDTDNLIWGVVNPSSAGSYILLQKSGSPSYSDMFRVDASGNITAAGQVKITGGSPGAGKVLTSDANGLASWVAPAGGSSQWTTNGSNIYYNTGKVGIGTVTPNNLIQVAGLINFNNGTQSTFLGNLAGNVSTGNNNTAVGDHALFSNTAGYANTANGYQALYSNTEGFSNTANGMNALYSNFKGQYNTANGMNALYSNFTGQYNTANGMNALRSNTTGISNTANGMNALYSNSGGGSNTANGLSALYFNTMGGSNTADGKGALYSNTTGNYNTANGMDALSLNTTGYYNTANGYQSLYDLNITTDDGSGSNTAVGYNTGRGIVTGVNNTILGANVTGLAAGLSNNIIIADGTGNRRINVISNGNVGIGTSTPTARLDLGQLPASTEGLKIQIGATSPYSPLAIIKADGTDAFRVKENGNVGIGTANPQYKLDVASAGFNVDTLTANLDFPSQATWARAYKVRGTYTGSPNYQAVYGAYGVTNNVQYAYFGLTTPSYHITGYNSPYLMTINQGGNVGIGTTNPGAKLEVAGQVKITGGTPGAGRVLTSDASGLASWAVAGSSQWRTAGSDIYYNLGKVGIGTAAPRTALELAGDGAILATGTFGSGWTEPNLGAGSRMMWYPKKGAFRAGRALGTQWDDVNIGAGSVAFNGSTIARGLSSAAFNGGTIASGNSSASFGNNTIASGANSVVFGNFATAQPFASMVIGQFNVISGNSFAWIPTDPVFVIGNGGDSTSLANALTVLKNGNVGIGTAAPTSKLQVVGLLEYANNAAATAAGLTIGALYRTGDLLKVVH